jgi:hypothetical protein
MLAQLDPVSVVLTVVKRRMVASPAVLQQKIFKTCVKQLMQRWKNCVDNDRD